MEIDTVKHSAEAYWKANLSLIIKLLIIWFTVPFLGGIVFVDVFNQVNLGGYPLGFWLAQQGSIYLFVALIFYYAKKMSDLDDQYDGDIGNDSDHGSDDSGREEQ